MTASGAEKLKAELEELKRVKRPAVIKAISEARAHGDLKENAEYHAAREQQGLMEARISDIEAKLGTAQIIDISKMETTGKVIFGATVTLYNVDTDQAVVYQIVGEDEADIKANKISVTSPLARSIIGKMAGDEVAVTTPSGVVNYEVEKVEYK
jgi:transcription elongation factor GreA